MTSGSADKIAIVGTGLVGRCWAIVFATAGFRVEMYDRDGNALTGALSAVEASLRDLQQFGLVDDPSSAFNRISLEPDLSKALAGACYAQESIPERLDAKKACFEELDEKAAPEVILASSSSGLLASSIAENLKRRERCLVAHPLNPPHIVPLVEVVPAPWTDANVVASTKRILERAGKIPIVLNREVPGFIVNRLQGAVLHEAFALVEEGSVSAQDVDKAMTEGLGMRWSVVGPFETIDLNAPRGVGDYAQRYGKMYLDFAKQRGLPKPWSNEVIQEINESMRKQLSVEEIPDRQIWRDRRLMSLAAHNKRNSG